MTDPFKLLGLDRRTATQADVKAAYARLLKTTRPEDDRAAFMDLRQAFEQARGIAKAQDNQRAQAEAQAPAQDNADAVGEAAAPPDIAPPAPQPQAAEPPPAWFFDGDLNWNFKNTPDGKLAQEAINWMVAGGPDADDFAARCAEALLTEPGMDAAAFRHELINYIFVAADSDELRHSQDVWEPIVGTRPDWLNDALIETLDTQMGLMRHRPKGAWDARGFNTVRGLFQPVVEEEDAPLPPPLDVETIFIEEENAARKDAHGSYIDPKTKVWVDMSPVGAAMRDLQAAIDRNLWDLPKTFRDILSRDEVQSLDEFQDLDARLRNLVCSATGWQSEARHPIYPDWLRSEVLLLLDDTFGWSRQHGRQMWQRNQYEWLHKVIERDRDIEDHSARFQPAPAQATANSPSAFGWVLREPRNLLIGYVGWRIFQVIWRLAF